MGSLAESVPFASTQAMDADLYDAEMSAEMAEDLQHGLRPTGVILATVVSLGIWFAILSASGLIKL